MWLMMATSKLTISVPTILFLIPLTFGQIKFDFRDSDKDHLEHPIVPPEDELSYTLLPPLDSYFLPYAKFGIYGFYAFNGCRMWAMWKKWKDQFVFSIQRVMPEPISGHSAKINLKRLEVLKSQKRTGFSIVDVKSNVTVRTRHNGETAIYVDGVFAADYLSFCPVNLTVGSDGVPHVYITVFRYQFPCEFYLEFGSGYSPYQAPFFSLIFVVALVTAAVLSAIFMGIVMTWEKHITPICKNIARLANISRVMQKNTEKSVVEKTKKEKRRTKSPAKNTKSLAFGETTYHQLKELAKWAKKKDEDKMSKKTSKKMSVKSPVKTNMASVHDSKKPGAVVNVSYRPPDLIVGPKNAGEADEQRGASGGLDVECVGVGKPIRVAEKATRQSG